MGPWSALYVLGVLLVGALCVEISEHECVVNTSPAIQEQCKKQDLAREMYMPSNDSIYHIFKPYYDEDMKYYTESVFNHHVDLRFVSQGASETFAERQQILINLFREWSGFAEERKLKYWIMHGSLIGWHWQLDVLPWDLDIDIQVLGTDLVNYYAHFNGFKYKDRYLFDVNPHSVFRQRQRHNIIDARFIDTANGYYIDLTGVSFDGEHLLCKSPHAYLAQWLFPLKRSTFCGVTTWVPNNVAACLISEYDTRVLDKDHFLFKAHRKKQVYFGVDINEEPGVPYRYETESLGWVKDT